LQEDETDKEIWIHVTGLCKNPNAQKLSSYLKSSKSGGGEIETFEVEDGKESAILKYKDKNGNEYVLRKLNYILIKLKC
jgi:hypothetical protein